MADIIDTISEQNEKIEELKEKEITVEGKDMNEEIIFSVPGIMKTESGWIDICVHEKIQIHKKE